jgi:hypothetical protein
MHIYVYISKMEEECGRVKYSLDILREGLPHIYINVYIYIHIYIHTYTYMYTHIHVKYSFDILREGMYTCDPVMKSSLCDIFV